MGEDWPALAIEGNKCGDTNQSPIDLKTSGWPTVYYKDDKFNGLFADLNGKIQIDNSFSNSKISLKGSK